MSLDELLNGHAAGEVDFVKETHVNRHRMKYGSHTYVTFLGVECGGEGVKRLKHHLTSHNQTA